MKLEFSRQISEKYSDIKFHETPSSCPVRGTDRHDEANCHFSKFCKRSQKSTQLYLRASLCLRDWKQGQIYLIWSCSQEEQYP